MAGTESVGRRVGRSWVFARPLPPNILLFLVDDDDGGSGVNARPESGDGVDIVAVDVLVFSFLPVLKFGTGLPRTPSLLAAGRNAGTWRAWACW